MAFLMSAKHILATQLRPCHGKISFKNYAKTLAGGYFLFIRFTQLASCYIYLSWTAMMVQGQFDPVHVSRFSFVVSGKNVKNKKKSKLALLIFNDSLHYELFYQYLVQWCSLPLTGNCSIRITHLFFNRKNTCSNFFVVVLFPHFITSEKSTYNTNVLHNIDTKHLHFVLLFVLHCL